MMNKRGQVTIFVIVGLVILVTVFLVFYLLGDKIKKQSEVETVFDESSLEPLQDYVGECIEKHGNEAIEKISNGGKIDPGFYYYYNNEKINYLCYSDGFGPCERKEPFLSKLFEDEIKNYVINKLSLCIDLNSLRNEGYDVQEGEMNVDVDVLEYSTLITLDYPITISKGDSRVSENKFVKTFNVPLGRIAEISKDVIDSEISYGEFFNQIYEVKHPEVTVKSYGPVEVVVYTISLRDYDYEFDYEFRFAVRSWV